MNTRLLLSLAPFCISLVLLLTAGTPPAQAQIGQLRPCACELFVDGTNLGSKSGPVGPFYFGPQPCGSEFKQVCVQECVDSYKNLDWSALQALVCQKFRHGTHTAGMIAAFGANCGQQQIGGARTLNCDPPPKPTPVCKCVMWSSDDLAHLDSNNHNSDCGTGGCAPDSIPSKCLIPFPINCTFSGTKCVHSNFCQPKPTCTPNGGPICCADIQPICDKYGCKVGAVLQTCSDKTAPPYACTDKCNLGP